MINVGIIDCGVIGGIMKKWLENHNPECKILVLDPPKGMNDDLSIADIIFYKHSYSNRGKSYSRFEFIKKYSKSLSKCAYFY